MNLRDNILYIIYFPPSHHLPPTLASRALLMRSFSFLRAALRGSDWRSWNRSCSSASNSLRLMSYLNTHFKYTQFAPHYPAPPQRLVPEAANINSGNLRSPENLAEAPHEGAVDSHQLLVVHHVGLVQHNTDLVVVTSQSLNASSELIADVELVGVEQKQNPVNSLSEPLQHAYEVVTSVRSLFLSAENVISLSLLSVNTKPPESHLRIPGVSTIEIPFKT